VLEQTSKIGKMSNKKVKPNSGDLGNTTKSVFSYIFSNFDYLRSEDDR